MSVYCTCTMSYVVLMCIRSVQVMEWLSSYLYLSPSLSLSLTPSPSLSPSFSLFPSLSLSLSPSLSPSLSLSLSLSLPSYSTCTIVRLIFAVLHIYIHTCTRTPHNPIVYAHTNTHVHTISIIQHRIEVLYTHTYKHTYIYTSTV